MYPDVTPYRFGRKPDSHFRSSASANCHEMFHLVRFGFLFRSIESVEYFFRDVRNVSSLAPETRS